MNDEMLYELDMRWDLRRLLSHYQGDGVSNADAVTNPSGIDIATYKFFHAYGVRFGEA